MNRGKKKGRRLLCSEGEQVHPKHCVTQAKAPPERGLRGELVPYNALLGRAVDTVRRGLRFAPSRRRRVFLCTSLGLGSVHKTDAPRAEAFIWLHLHALPLDVVVAHST